MNYLIVVVMLATVTPPFPTPDTQRVIEETPRNATPVPFLMREPT